MKIKCEYCGSFISDTDDACPHCGAPNRGVQRSGSGVPKTIAELRAFCEAKKLPLEKMRFFIGQNYTAPRAYGIYQDEEGMFVVYKNKSDGSRAVRYRGTDEAYAVNEIYQKLKSEVTDQRRRHAARQTQAQSATSRSNPMRSAPMRTRRKNTTGRMARRIILVLLLIWFVVIGLFSRFQDQASHHAHNGYYNYNGGTYYYQNDDWYLYDDDLYDWTPVLVDPELEDHYDDYYTSSYYSDDYGVEDFGDSFYYVEPDYSGGWDDDNDWNWDNDDWDDDDDWDWGGDDWDDDWDWGGDDWDDDW